MCFSRNCVQGQAQGGRGLLDRSPHSLATESWPRLGQVAFGHCLCLGFSLGLSFGTGFGLRFGTGFSLGLVDVGRCLGFGLGLVLGFGLSQVDLGGYCLGFGCRLAVVIVIVLLITIIIITVVLILKSLS